MGLDLLPEKQATQAEESLRNDLSQILAYYEQIFNESQTKAIVLFWYGHTPKEVAESLGVTSTIVNTWLSDRTFLEALKAGTDRRKEIINLELDKLSYRALEIVKSIFKHDINPWEKGFKEYVTTVRWLLDKTGLLESQQSLEAQSKSTVRIDDRTIQLLADEIKSEVGGGRINIKIEDLFLGDVVEGIIHEFSKYYNVVYTKKAMVNHGVLNVLVPKEVVKVAEDEDDTYQEDTDYKLQCHLCGRWYSSLSGHIGTKVHEGVTVSSYRSLFGIPTNVSLVVDDKIVEIIEEKLKADIR